MDRLTLAASVICAALLVGCNSQPHSSIPDTQGDDFAMKIAGDIDRATSPSALREQLEDADIDTLAKTVAALRRQESIYVENIANVQTCAFKSSRIVQNGPATFATALDFAQGVMVNTGRQLDIAISGAGLLRVTLPNGEAAYTRSGNLFINSDGTLVVGTLLGARISPETIFPLDTTDVAIAEDGTIDAIVAGSNSPITIGRIELYRFLNPHGLESATPASFRQTKASGEAIASKPGEDGAGEIRQNFLESSNVDLTRERLLLVRVQRQLEMIDRLLTRYEQNAPAVASRN